MLYFMFSLFFFVTDQCKLPGIDTKQEMVGLGDVWGGAGGGESVGEMIDTKL